MAGEAIGRSKYRRSKPTIAEASPAKNNCGIKFLPDARRWVSADGRSTNSRFWGRHLPSQKSPEYPWRNRVFLICAVTLGRAPSKKSIFGTLSDIRCGGAAVDPLDELKALCFLQGEVVFAVRLNFRLLAAIVYILRRSGMRNWRLLDCNARCYGFCKRMQNRNSIRACSPQIFASVSRKILGANCNSEANCTLGQANKPETTYGGDTFDAKQ